MSVKQLPIVEQDPWLEPVADEIQNRYNLFRQRLDQIEAFDGTKRLSSIVDYANAHRYFGWQRDEMMKGWWFREWLPAAHDVYIFGDFNGWQRTQLRLSRAKDGVWSIFLPDALYGDKLTHQSLYKIHVNGDNGWLDRIPAYATRVVQDDYTKDFVAQLWAPEQQFVWGDKEAAWLKRGRAKKRPLLIYEAHVGMAVEREGVGTYVEFTENILPQIKKKGYTALQLMAVAEHPYYGSFGYHVSSLFAPSSRFGTPEELKALVQRAHELGITVIMDIVHAHYVKNINEGINALDGSDYQYSLPGEAGYQKYWDSKVFDFSKHEVQHLLLSNVKYWMDEYHFDGYRFDGVTSMLYHHHGYTEFDSRDKFFNEDINRPALTYLTLANHLIHSLSPHALSIAEDVSGMPALCAPIEDGGTGFDYRLAMAIPDYWIRILEDERDEDWDIWEMWDIMTSRLKGVHTIAYAESHDQAMVGDKTIAFRLMDKEMYTSMNRATPSIVIDRGMALHKIFRLITITMGGEAYLNFMGNEFGHPEWIDFPREGNGWGYQYARRQWSLQDNGFLRYSQLGAFDKAMLKAVTKEKVLRGDGEMCYPYRLHIDQDNKTMVYRAGKLLVVVNLHPTASIPDYEIYMGEAGSEYAGKYKSVLTTDDKKYGGLSRIATTEEHFTYERDGSIFMKIYNTSRTATLYKIED